MQVNSLRLKSNVATKWTSKHLCHLLVPFILLLTVQNIFFRAKLKPDLNLSNCELVNAMPGIMLKPKILKKNINMVE